MAYAVLNTGIQPSEWKALTVRERRAFRTASHDLAEQAESR